MWNMKFLAMPTVTGSTGILDDGLRKYLEAIT
jgi:hypothetical protein